VARFAIAGIQMRASATEDNAATMRHRLAALMAIYHWPRQATLRQSFSDFEEEETMIHLKPLRASFKTRTVS
jgi:hypothetical protein